VGKCPKKKPSGPWSEKLKPLLKPESARIAGLPWLPRFQKIGYIARRGIGRVGCHYETEKLSHLGYEGSLFEAR